jgi:hypothetical protein
VALQGFLAKITSAHLLKEAYFGYLWHFSWWMFITRVWLDEYLVNVREFMKSFP